MSKLERLQQAIRKAAGSQAWSQGTVLVRKGAVLSPDRQAGEIACRVRVPNRAVPHEAVLYPEDQDWECSCDSARDACAHVSAAIIAVLGGHTENAPQPGRVHYLLTRSAKGVTCLRVIREGDDELPLRGTLASMVSGRVKGPEVVPEPGDLELDQVLDSKWKHAISAKMARALVKHADNSSRVSLDGNAIVVSDRPLVPTATLRDAGNGVALQLSPAPELREPLGSALGLDEEGRLRALAPVSLAGENHEHLPFRKEFEPHALAELAAEIVPTLRREMNVVVETERLPGSRRAKPRIDLKASTEDGLFAVLATLVYGDPPQARIDGERMVHLQGDAPIRDRDAEQQLIHKLRAELNLVLGKKVVVAGPEAQELAARIAKWGSASVASAELIPSVEQVGALPHVVFRTEGDEAVDSGVVLQAHRAGLSVVPLGSGFARIPQAWLDENAHLIAEIVSAGDSSQQRYARQAMAELCTTLGAQAPDMGELKSLLEGGALPEAPLPQDLGATLRDYQKTGVNWMHFLKTQELGGVLADDMGLGKTLQALCVVGGKTLVVCPKSVLFNWQAEAERFRPGLRVSRYHGAKRSLDPEADLTLTTYAMVRNDLAELAKSEWDTVILDEAQAIKNPNSQTARAIFDLPARVRFALSGTPIENRLEELWSILRFATPGLFPSLAEFKDYYASPIAAGDKKAADRLRRRIAPYLLRRVKSDVAPELPPRTDALLRVELDDDERGAYNAIAAASRGELNALLAKGKKLAVLEALLRLRQAACHRGLLPGQELTASSSKTEALLGALEQAAAAGHRALVFSQWTSFLDKIEPLLEQAGLAFCRLDGSTRDRQAVVAQFQDPAGPPVMLASLKAGGTGLNLTAADHVFIMDPWWNPAAEDQAADRAHRIGQDKPVFVYRVVAKDTVEDKILELQRRKRSLAELAAPDFEYLLA